MLYVLCLLLRFFLRFLNSVLLFTSFQGSIETVQKKREANYNNSPSKHSRKEKLTFPDPVEEEDSTKEYFVPESLHACVGYKRKGTNVSSFSESEKLIFDFIEQEVNVPRDFEVNRKYGSLSWVSFEERLLSAYIHGQLTKYSSDIAKEAQPQVRKLIIEDDYDSAALLLSKLV